MQIKTSQSKAKTILFYDGACPLCHASVRFVLKRDKHDSLYVSPLQGETIKKKKIDAQEMKSIILYTQDGEILYKSDAIISLLERLGGIWYILARVLKVIPRIIRDAMYDLIAKIRYRFAGKIDDKTCPLLPKNYQSKILL